MSFDPGYGQAPGTGLPFLQNPNLRTTPTNTLDYRAFGQAPGAITNAYIAPSGFVGSTRPAKGTKALSAGQMQLQDILTNTVIRGLGQPTPVYGGPGVPGATMSQQLAHGQAHLPQQMAQGTQGAIDTLLSGGADPDAVTDYYTRNVVNPSKQIFRDTMMGIGERYGNTYGRSGGFLRGMGGATNDYLTNLSGQLAKLQFDERNQGFGRMAQGISGSLGQQGQMGQNLLRQLAIGGDERSIQSQLNQEQLSQWEAQQPWGNPWLGLAGGVLGTQVRAPNEAGRSTFSDVMQGIGAGSQLLSSLVSLGGLVGGGA